VTLSNACTTSGCSVTNPIYWDENSGTGCTSRGCPSTAYENTIGSIPSETFSLGSNCMFDCPPECVSDAPQDGFKIIHNFTGNEQSPVSGLTTDRAGGLYGTTWGGDNGLGLAYRLAASAQDWTFTPLYSFLGGAGGQNPLLEILGPESALYGAADGGIQNCGSSRNQYCGVVYKLRLSPFACPTALCNSWTEDVIYQFTGDPDGWGPGGKLVVDQAGNLYGTTGNGGAYGQGTVYELTPSPNGGWTEKVIYSFTGGSDGAQPDSLLLGRDGNLYGTTLDDWSGAGVIFQLVLSGDSWTELVLASYGGCHDAFPCPPLLLQQSRGNLYGISGYERYICQQYGCVWYTFGQIFMMSPSQSGWRFSVLADTYNPDPGPYYYDAGYDVFHDLAVDAAGTVYGTEGWVEPANFYNGWVFRLVQPGHEQALVGFAGDDFGDVELGVSGKLYGTTGTCGGSKGTVWQLTPPE